MDAMFIWALVYLCGGVVAWFFYKYTLPQVAAECGLVGRKAVVAATLAPAATRLNTAANRLAADINSLGIPEAVSSFGRQALAATDSFFRRMDVAVDKPAVKSFFRTVDAAALNMAADINTAMGWVGHLTPQRVLVAANTFAILAGGELAFRLFREPAHANSVWRAARDAASALRIFSA